MFTFNHKFEVKAETRTEECLPDRGSAFLSKQVFAAWLRAFAVCAGLILSLLATVQTASAQASCPNDAVRDNQIGRYAYHFMNGNSGVCNNNVAIPANGVRVFSSWNDCRVGRLTLTGENGGGQNPSDLTCSNCTVLGARDGRVAPGTTADFSAYFTLSGSTVPVRYQGTFSRSVADADGRFRCTLSSARIVGGNFGGDAVRPTATIGALSGPNGSGQYTAAITLSEPSTNFAVGDLALTNASAALTGGGANYTLMLTPDAPGQIAAQVTRRSFTDAADNRNAAASNQVQAQHVIAPTAVTNDETAVTQDSVTFNGVVNAGGASTAVTFIYGTNSSSLNLSATAAQSPVSGTADTAVTAAINGLLSDTRYYVRVRAENSEGVTTGGLKSFTTPAAPEIEVRANNTQIIESGDTTPRAGDNTLFSNTAVANVSTATERFDIRARTSAGLRLGPNAVSFTGPDANQFSVLAQPPATLGSFGDTDIRVRFTPTSAGVKNATVNIASNDADENPYTFAIRATAEAAVPDIEITLTVHDITNGDLTPEAANNTDFGNSAVVGGAQDGTSIRIENVGTSVLTLGANAVTFTGVDADQFSIAAQPPATLAVGGSYITQLRFVPTSAGVKNAVVNIANDDPDESPFTFAIRATATAAPGATTQAASAVTTVGATLNGDINPGNRSTAVTFEYGLTNAYGTTVTAAQSPLTGTADTAVSAAVSGLTPGETYHYRVVGVNSNGTTNGADMTFMTAGVPEIEISSSESGAVADGGTDAQGNQDADTAKTVTYTITNTGSAPLTLTEAAPQRSSVVNTNAPTLGTYSQTVIPAGGGTATFTVTYTPTTAGAFSFNLDVLSDDADEGTYDITVSGTAIGSPEITVRSGGQEIVDGDTTPAQANNTEFSSIATINDGPESESFGIQNNGTGVLTLGPNAVTFTGTDASQFSVNAQPPVTIATSGAANITIVFTPTSAGVKNAVVNIASDDADENPYTFAVRATAIVQPAATTAAASAVTVTGAALNGTVNPGNASTTVTFEYGLTNSYGNTVAAAQSPLTGTTDTAVSAALTGLLPATTYHYRVVAVNSEGTDRGADMAFTTGGLPEIAISSSEGGAVVDGSTDAQGDQTEGVAKTVTYTITNSGPVPLALVGAAPSIFGANNVGAPTVGNYSAASVAANGGTATFTVTYTPVAQGVFGFDLDILSDDVDESPYDVAVSGTATDGIAPNVSIMGVPTLTTGTDAFVATFTFSEDVTDFDDTADIMVTNGSAGAITATSNSVYTARITPNGNGNVTVTVPAGAAVDGGNNGNTAAAPQTATFNSAPTAEAGTAQSVNEMVSVTLDGSGSTDPQGNMLTYAWTQTGGTNVTLSDVTAESPTFTAPTLANNTPVTLTFSLIVNDGAVDSTADTVTVTVNNINTAPVADAGAAQTVNEAVFVTLSGAASSDAENDALTYAWTQMGGTNVTLSDATAVSPTFTAPTLTNNTPITLAFSLVVNDGTVDSAADTVAITVNNINTAPVANAGAPQSINEAATVTLSGGSSTDADADALTYVWTQTGGANVALSDAAAESPTFMAPTLSDNTPVTLTFSLTVNDGTVDSAADTIAITVNNINTAPVAEAGAAQTVNEAISVSLSGAVSSDADNDALTYAWTQTGGPNVTLSDVSSVSPTFTAPTLNNNTPVTLTFSLTVNDGRVDSAADTVSITVNNVNSAPVAEAGNAQTVNEAVTVTLNADGSSDADRDSLTYVWTQTGGAAVVLSDTTSANPTFTAPTLTSNDPVSLTFSLTVNDGIVDSSADTVTIKVNNINTAPVANAGQDQTGIAAGTNVTLSAQGSSDADGDSLTYLWSQTSGSVVSLSSKTAAAPSFTAPSVPSAETLVFSLVVNDGQADSQAASVSVALLENTAPTVKITDVPETVTGTFTVSFVFSENVTGFTASDIVLTNAGASDVAGSGAAYTALITPADDGAITIDVPAEAAIDAAGNKSESAAQVSTRMDNTAPNVVLSGVPDSVRGPFDLIVTFNETVTGFDAADLVLTNASAGPVTDNGNGAFTIIITPTSHGDAVMSVPAGAAKDMAGNPNEASNVLTTNFIDEVLVKARTQGVVHNFMARRADQITINDPDLSARLLTDTETDGRLSGSGDLKNMRLAFNGAINAEDTKLVRMLGAEKASRLNMWIDAGFSRAKADTSKLTLGLVHAGVDYRLDKDTVMGVMAQYDWGDETDDTQGFDISGTGWMAGPYVVSRLTDSLVFDGRFAYGQSYNEVSPFGTYTDEFSSDRILLKGQLTGTVDLNAWKLNPQAAVIYFKEESEAYQDSLGITINGQTVSLGRVTFGPRLSRSFKTQSGLELSPGLSVKGIWDFDTPGTMDLTTGLFSGEDAFRSRIEAEFIARLTSGTQLSFDGFYDGIGSRGFEAYGVKFGMRFDFE